MLRIIITAVIVLSLLSLPGCAELSGLTQNLTDDSSQPGFEIIKEAQITPKWEMNQISIVLGAGDELSLLLQIDDGDRVDGYFYLEKGDDVSFEIKGTSLIYQSGAGTNPDEEETGSDRFSFIGTQPQGNTYTMTFRNPAAETEQTEITVFVEIIFPATGEMFFPVEAWKS